MGVPQFSIRLMLDGRVLSSSDQVALGGAYILSSATSCFMMGDFPALSDLQPTSKDGKDIVMIMKLRAEE